MNPEATMIFSSNPVFEDDCSTLESDINGCIQSRRARLVKVSTRFARIQKIYMSTNNEIKLEIKQVLEKAHLTSHVILNITGATNHVLVHIEPKISTLQHKTTNEIYVAIFKMLKMMVETIHEKNTGVEESDFVIIDDGNDLIFYEDCVDSKNEFYDELNIDKFKDFDGVIENSDSDIEIE